MSTATMSGPGVAQTTPARGPNLSGGPNVPKGIPVGPGVRCAVGGCDNPHHAAGLCSRHYRRWRRHGDPTGGPTRLSGSLIERALTGLDRSGECWVWTLGLNDAGYGMFRAEGRLHRVHRVTYEHFVGPIPDDLEIDHLCRNRACARPDHLEAVPHVVNLRRGSWATRAHCKYGHPFDAANTRRDGKGRRTCLACEERRRRKPLGPPAPRACEECGTTFQPERRSGRFCSKSCSWRSWDKRRWATHGYRVTAPDGRDVA